MSTQDSTVPCKFPWKIYDYEKSSDTVDIHANKGSSIQVHDDLHVSVLRHRSGFFHTHLDETQTGRSRPVITFPVDNFAVLAAYTTWLYQGRLSRDDSSLPTSRLFYCQLYAFALRSDTPMLQNAALDEFLLTIDEDNSVRGDLTDYVKHNCPGSKMWQLIEDVGSGRRPRVRKQLGEMHYPICGRYHVHAEADLRDGELFYIDPPGSGGKLVKW
ncbi:hypothetical protein HBH56_132120 [Parastagonospora nodorum]|uniref:BTB domain-containing protein n=1 Tax=Phaeosphaeria nodorum (strain SN15 / ATCC MYA-4574 / FGSC 10173) TaxID=321614 RepID=A0A7U2I4B0_PHANO|nr:hypothetical protein HBH56_132120 [Parastagonospora nodorum]QRD02841.1 hypothetical protein JI435_115650 [Parastagonospora nodorum SN15]KAH3926954.1 hypothetical protein HBH54_161100 [Parastagonospora nodorum]KAH3977626.1 hypothetical protein HBH51_068800 [Parastagonospora nodorum]KAH4105322.1 hypothetical protein HBH46_090100 [Parastagonospora nodorum]